MEDLTVLTNDELEALETEAREAFDALRAEGSPDVEALRRLHDSILAVRAERERRAAEDEALRAEIEAMAADLDPEPAPAAEVPGDEPAEAEVPAEAPADDVVVPEPVPASAARPAVDLALIRRHAPRPRVETAQPGPAVTITAAADIPGVPAAARLDFDGLASAMQARARALPVVAGGGNRTIVASIDRPIPAEYALTDSDGENEAVFARIAERARGGAQALTAAGWCAPNEVIYDFFAIDAADCLVDLPRVTARRGGIKWPVSPTIADVMTHLFTWTDAQDKAGTDSKACFVIPCPTWDECTLEAYGLCITASNLTDRAFPELTRRYVNLLANAHEHAVSAALLTAMATAAADVTMGAGALTSDAYGDLLGAIDLQAADYRSQYRMSEAATLEVVLPSWVLPMLRSDLAKRAGVDLLAVTDQMLRAHFNARNVRAQFVCDWQPLYGSAAATAWPATVKFLLYAAGTFVVAHGGTLDLGVTRDSVLNAKNDHTAAFSEEFLCLGQIGHSAREVTVAITPDGVTACCA